MVLPFSVSAYCTLGGLVPKTVLPMRPRSSSIFNFFERTRELTPFKDLRSPSKPIGLRVDRTVSISIDHLLKIVLTIIRLSSVDSDELRGKKGLATAMVSFDQAAIASLSSVNRSSKMSWSSCCTPLSFEPLPGSVE